MPFCPHCQKTLLFVDVRREVIRRGRYFHPPVLSAPKCPFCGGEVEPQRLFLSRSVLVVGTLVSLPSGVFLSFVLTKFYSPSGINGVVMIGLPVFGLLTTIFCAKAIVRYGRKLP